VLLLVGLARLDSATATLLLNLEAPLTAAIAVLVFREHLGARGTFWWLANIAEAAFSEQRGSSRGVASGGELNDAASGDAPAAEFARYVVLYRKDREAGASSK
jgi:hypothetical protein